ncbi:MAG TPA: hypothetical protein VLQ45_29955 [Thermoanaerobaculia bacterium]|nr:hypothetical protein [Thermoanaerobaculia bacterium]
MPYQRLSESVQTLYAELFEQTVHAQADAAAAGSSQGSFVSKTVKGGTYWYLQRMEGDGKRQRYLGANPRPSWRGWRRSGRRVPGPPRTSPSGRSSPACWPPGERPRRALP